MQTPIRRLFPLIALLFSTLMMEAQPAFTAAAEINNPAKPYRIQTSGKQITIKSTKDIKTVMVWSAGGNRILEQKDINTDSYNFRLTVNEKVLFIRIQLIDGKVYSERIGIR